MRSTKRGRKKEKKMREERGKRKVSEGKRRELREMRELRTLASSANARRASPTKSAMGTSGTGTVLLKRKRYGVVKSASGEGAALQNPLCTRAVCWSQAGSQGKSVSARVR